MNTELEVLSNEFVSDVLNAVKNLESTEEVNAIIHRMMAEVEDDLCAFVGIGRMFGDY